MPACPRRICCTLLLTLAGLGCSNAGPVNPSFAVTMAEARQAMREMAAPRPLARPLVIVGGYLDPNVSPTYLKHQIHKVSGDERIIGVMVGFHDSFDECRRAVIDAVDRAFPGDDPLWTSEVDVIGVSLGGLVARYAAAESRDADHPRRLRIARLFTISSPHQGAALANFAALNEWHRDMVSGSPFMLYLGGCDAAAGYELYPYARLRDHLVGEELASPAGHTPIWLAPPPLEGGHGGAWRDHRIIADIARRLRGESPFSTEPRAPLPCQRGG